MEELLKDLEGLGCFDDVGAGISVKCAVCEYYGDITEEQRKSGTIYPAEQKKTCQNYYEGCAPATLRYIAKKLAELGYVKVTRCKDCVYLEQRKLEDDGRVLYLCTSPHSHYKHGFASFSDQDYCAHGEPKEGE